MEWWEAVLLGLVQGLTEFLPVSSSGHLVLGKYLLGLDLTADSVAFEVFVHFGTVLSILTVYWRQVLRLISTMSIGLMRPASLGPRYREDEDFRIGLFILITLIPTGAVYILFKHQLEGAFQEPRLVAGMLLVTACLLVLTKLRSNPSGELSPAKAFVIGIAQAAAMIPGISRSGSTICTALYQNVTPEKAANFSFLMLLPVVLGATIAQSFEIYSVGLEMGWLPLFLGTVVSYASGVVAIYLMLGFVRRGNLHYFAYYLFVVGGLGLLFI
jgi:undecaprenyl-diphosphatase